MRSQPFRVAPRRSRTDRRIRSFAALRTGVPAAVALGVAAVSAACASQAAPRGGPEDILPPVVTGTRPDTFARVDSTFEGPVRIEFTERISETPAQGLLERAVVVSPRTGRVDVRHRRDALEVEVLGGFRPGMVYRVTVLPVIEDMFNNRLQDPFEFVFSTGGDIVPSVVAGIVVDRITGLPVGGATVHARSLADTSVVYLAQADTGGVYALRYVPPGEYAITAFEDPNGNGVLNVGEARGDTTFALALADTLLTDLVVLGPDTTPAFLRAAEVEDSLALRLTTDDYLEPGRISEIEISIQPDSLAGPDAPPAPGVVRVFLPDAYSRYRDSVRAAVRAAADSARADSLGEPIPPPVREPTPPRRRAGENEALVLLEGPLPTQSVVAVLEAPLPAGIPYAVTVTGMVNVRGVLGGGGRRTVLREVPTEPGGTSEAVDTSGVSVDTLTRRRR